jgi:hypothetical protein
MINAIRFKEVEIGAYTFPGRKKPYLAIRDLKKNAIYAYGQFHNEESAAEFMDQLAAAIGIIKEAVNESDND